MVIVVEEGERELVLAFAERRGDGVEAGVGIAGGDVDGADVLAVDAEDHADRLGAGLVAGGADFEAVEAVGGGVEGESQLAAGGEGSAVAGEVAAFEVGGLPGAEGPERGLGLAEEGDLMEDEVTVTLGGVGMIGLVEVVGEGERESPFAGLLHGDFGGVVRGGIGVGGGDVEGAEGLAVELGKKFGRFVAGLLTVGGDLEAVDATVGEGEAVVDLDVGGEAAVGRGVLKFGGVPGGDLAVVDAGGGQSTLGQALGDREVFFEQERGQAEDVADGVEAVADVVEWEQFGPIDADAEEVANGVEIFGTIEAAKGDASWLFDGAIAGGEQGVEVADEGFALGVGGSGLAVGGHDACVDVLDDGLPEAAVGCDGGFVGCGVEPDTGFGLGLAVAGNAIAVEKRADPGGEGVVVGDGTGAGGEADEEEYDAGWVESSPRNPVVKRVFHTLGF